MTHALERMQYDCLQLMNRVVVRPELYSRLQQILGEPLPCPLPEVHFDCGLDGKPHQYVGFSDIHIGKLDSETRIVLHGDLIDARSTSDGK